MISRKSICLAAAAWTCIVLGLAVGTAQAQNFRYESKPRADVMRASFDEPEPAPRLLPEIERAVHREPPAGRGYLYPRKGRTMAQRVRYDAPTPARRPTPAQPPLHEVEEIPHGAQADPFSDDYPSRGYPESGYEGDSFDGEAYEGEYSEGEYFEGDEFYGEGYPAACCDECGPSYWETLHCLCMCLKQSYLYSPGMWRNFNTITGAQGFKGPADLGVNGNFGFTKGLNWATPLWNAHGIGHQLGGALVFSDFEGKNGPLGHDRFQYFVTTGVFRRPKYGRGLQGGAALDYLHDNFYVNMNLLQIRAELSYVMGYHEIGFWGAFHINQDTQFASTSVFVGDTTWQANDQYNLFYRRNCGEGRNYRMWVGLTSQADVLFGSDATAKLSDHWNLVASTNYLLPTGNNAGAAANTNESFNVGVYVTWQPFAPKCDPCPNRYRPLFGVADNGTMMIRTK